MDIRHKFGMRIAHLRKIRNLTQEQLADKIHRTIDTVSAIERGKSMPNFQTLEKLATIFQLEPKDLFDFSSETIQSNETIEKKSYLIRLLDDLNAQEVDFLISIIDNVKQLRSD